jgi:hypothetical protein
MWCGRYRVAAMKVRLKRRKKMESVTSVLEPIKFGRREPLTGVVKKTYRMQTSPKA